MNILVIGSGGREHALAWKLKQSSRVQKIYAAPGNGGMAEIAECLPTPIDDLPGLLKIAKEKSIHFVVVGPELPLTLGIADLFKREGIACFGPSKEASQLEGSKTFTKELLRSEKIPTAAFESFTDFNKAVDHLDTQPYPIVIKADGLAAGKGVLICKDRKEALDALNLVLNKKAFGDAGLRVIVEEFLEGQEASVHALVDGKNICPLVTSQDHKRIFDGDEGPNTGGMGAYSPNPFISKELEAKILKEIIEPTVRGLAKRGIEFRGVLFCGIMLTDQGPKVLEYNVRFGDPETQSILMRLNSDLFDLLESCATGTLKGKQVVWRKETSICVVMASEGYPGVPRKGDLIEGLEKAATGGDTVVFHAGTKSLNNKIVTSGGRVLGVCSLGKDIRAARLRVYDSVDKIYWKGVQFRKDVGLKALKGGNDV
jgi:phosphoribosylamine---glycine ligase